jgi:hypothetical protein
MKKLDKIRHFRNIEKSEARLKVLLTKLEFDTAAHFLAHWQAAH